jgi:hypothetical protein
MFGSAKLKLERAKYYIAGLKQEIKSFVLTKPCTCVINNDSKTGKVFVDIINKNPLPSTIPLTIGDAVHNLHCVLDHVFWETVGMDGGKQDRFTKFPFGADKASYEGTINGIDTPSQWVKDLFISFEAFPYGRGSDHA